MDSLEFKILAKRQTLRDLLTFALSQVAVYLPIVRELKAEISICDYALRELHSKRASARLG